jgi:predicted  nucleic acid-binding Zn-ribbon protein
MEQKLDIEHRLSQVETKVEALENRQDDLDKLVSTVSALAVREERMESDVKEIKADVKSLTSKSGKRWDDLVDKAIWAVAAAAIAFLLGSAGW